MQKNYIKSTLIILLLAPLTAFANPKVDECIKHYLPISELTCQIFARRCDLTAEDMPALVAYLNQTKNKVQLSFENNDTGSGGIGDNGLEILMTAKNIHRLELDGNHITDSGINFLSDADISAISLNDNFITSKGAVLLAKLKFLTWLEIKGNYLGDGGATALAKSISIDTLNVSSNHLTYNGAIALSKAYRISWLEIQDNNISDKGFIALMSLPRLNTLIAGKNNIGDASIAAAASKPLDHLMLDGNEITDAGAIAFTKAANYTYSYLDFYNNHNLSCVGIHALKDRYGNSVRVDEECRNPYPDSEKRVKNKLRFKR
jgi:hypothetical protein